MVTCFNKYNDVICFDLVVNDEDKSFTQYLCLVFGIWIVL